MATVFGLEVADLDDGCIPTEAIVFVKIVDEDGRDCWARRGTEGISDQEAIGILHCDIARITGHVNGHWVNDEGDQ